MSSVLAASESYLKGSPQDQCCNAVALEDLFKSTFLESDQTVLVGGVDEPLYQPSEAAGFPHQIYYREDFVSSALHEIAHWCLAGEARRQRVDYGYWYLPDGRDETQQRLFERVEIKPQALEWMFAEAAGHKFHFSVDNLNGEGVASQYFVNAACKQAQQWCRQGMPSRGGIFINALNDHFATTNTRNPKRYCSTLVVNKWNLKNCPELAV